MSEKDGFFNDNKFFPSFKELKGLYGGWKVVKICDGFTDYEEHDGIGKHRHNLIVMLARKGLVL